jgi:hypothetical protein
VTPNGKLDTCALPRPAGRAEEVRDLGPLESAVAELWRTLPGVRVSGAHAGFFESGGHSLLSMLLLSRINAAFAVDLTIGDFLREPTIAGLAVAIERARTSRRRRSPLRRVPRRPLRARLDASGMPVLSTALCQRLLSLTGGLP